MRIELAHVLFNAASTSTSRSPQIGQARCSAFITKENAQTAVSSQSRSGQASSGAFLFPAGPPSWRCETPPALPLPDVLVRHPRDGVHLLGVVGFNAIPKHRVGRTVEHDKHGGRARGRSPNRLLADAAGAARLIRKEASSSRRRLPPVLSCDSVDRLRVSTILVETDPTCTPQLVQIGSEESRLRWPVPMHSATRVGTLHTLGVVPGGLGIGIP